MVLSTNVCVGWSRECHPVTIPGPLQDSLLLHSNTAPAPAAPSVLTHPAAVSIGQVHSGRLPTADPDSANSAIFIGVSLTSDQIWPLYTTRYALELLRRDDSSAPWSAFTARLRMGSLVLGVHGFNSWSS